MKYLIFFFITIISTSCCGMKSNAESIAIEPSQNIEPIETTEIETQIENNSIIKMPLIENQTDTFNHELWNNLLQKYVSDKGNVNYKGFKNDHSLLKDYINSLSKNMPNEDWTKEDKLAYWINAYNAMTIDLILKNYPLKSIKDIDKPWEQRIWQLGDTWYNLEDIEHQILRKMNEPRIHFAIVCASYSCPKLLNKAYTSSLLESQLTQATKDFLSDPERNIITENSIKLSKIFSWFEKDFKQNGSLIDFLNQYSDITISKNAKKRFLDYNWNLNE